ncbi:hypothetical protein HFX_0500 [Haloferax mediterranei ATCC 33500]|uniref:YndJ-like protein n=1 Tax=Haloferax mediterranei (strain ATCC 33500 / DSM 1411 / JCM 8866 / NBRC 14739 / NCIMB 2177 / R-4) TaxID=523841 RepID=I3R1W7_HALMT|nr:hypothetical protein HFX_0500 [Haloferax mediterranei ATCC 33500]
MGWLILVVSGVFGPIQDIIALAMLVLVPLAVRLADTPRRDGTRSGWYRIAVVGQPMMALLGVFSLTMPPGAAAVLTALPWAATTGAVAGFGAWRLLQRGPWPIEELSVDAGLLYIVVGGAALLFDRAGVSLVFEPIIVTLTIVHFHYAGSALPILAGMAGRHDPGGQFDSLFRVTTAIIVVGPGIIGTGITAVALDFPLAATIEFIAVAFFTTAVALFSVAVIAGVLPLLSSWPQRLLLGGASLAVTVSMGFAVVYGFARATGGTYFGIGPQSFGTMVTYHGQLNAYGFAVPALVGWRLAIPESRARSPGIPISRLTGGWSIGEDFLERRELTGDATVSGMMDEVDAYQSDRFDPSAVAPSVRRFFERSGDYELAVSPDWKTPWRQLAILYRPVATWIGQLSVPLVSATGELALSGRVVAVNGVDAQTGDRAWVRSNAGRATGADSMTYVGIYDRYVSTGRSYLRVTFPLSGSNLTGILRVENGGADGEALVLSSFPEGGNGDDAGLYLLVGGGSVRLPLNETLVVEPDDESGSVHAVHRVELLGVRVFTLRYDIRLAVGR